MSYEIKDVLEVLDQRDKPTARNLEPIGDEAQWEARRHEAHRKTELTEGIRRAINYSSGEVLGGNVPDFILAELLVDVLAAFGKAVKANDAWHGRK